MNITIIRLRDLIKYLICFILIIAIISIGINMLKEREVEEELEKTSTGVLDNIKTSSFLYCLRTELSLISMNEEINEKAPAQANVPERILSTELSIMSNLEEYNETDDTELEENVEKIESKEEVQEETKNLEVAENLETQIISENNINATYTNEGSNVKINNQTGYDITDILNNPSYEITNKDKIIIYHTHTCESYTSSDAYSYEMTGAYRTTDLNYTVSKVGDELTKYLEEYGKTVIHDTTYHDYPAYNGSYGRSLKTMENVLNDNSDAEITIDLHRDAVRK